MKRRTLLTLLAGGTFAGASLGYGLSRHGWASDRDGHHGKHHGGRHGRGHKRWNVDQMALQAESHLAIRPEQRPAFDALVAKLQAAEARFHAAKDEMKGAETAPEHLTHFERMATEGLEILRDVRPEVDAFYAVLDDTQRARLDRWINERHHG
jgi:hypothetical protein